MGEETASEITPKLPLITPEETIIPTEISPAISEITQPKQTVSSLKIKPEEQSIESLAQIQRPISSASPITKISAIPPKIKPMGIPDTTAIPDSISEPLDMARVIPSMARIQPSPIIPTGEIKPTKDILFDVSKSIGLNVQYKGSQRAAIGTYFPGSSKVAIRYAGDLDTTAHELAHALDDRFGLVAEWATPRTKSPFDPELIELFAPHGSITKTSPLIKKRAEGVAEFIRAWIVNPEETSQVAPKFTKYFEEKIPLQTKQALQSFSKDLREFAGAKPEDKILANVRYEPDGTLDQLK